MSQAPEAVQPGPRAQAEALAEALAGKGFTVTILKSGGHRFHPCVLIASSKRPHVADHVYVAPEDGQWWFWWSNLELIAPAGEVTIAADVIASAFARDCSLSSREEATA
jgi:hypothetical protein